MLTRSVALLAELSRICGLQAASQGGSSQQASCCRRYAATDASVEAALDSCDAFGQLLDAAGKVAAQHAEMAGGDVAAMFIALAQFAAAVYPGQLGLVDRVLVACHEVSASNVGLGLG